MGRSRCCSKEGLNRGAWTKTEDMILSEYVRVHGDRGWQKVPQKAGLNRCGRSCRLRWRNYLRPDIKRGNISSDEEELMIRMHRLLGNRWSLIAGRLPGRTDNEIKNYWKSHLSQNAKNLQSKRPSSQKSPPPLQNHVFRSTPVKITPNVSKGYGYSNIPSSDLAFKFSNVKETTNCNSKSAWCHLLANDSIIEDDSNCIAFAVTDVNLVQTEARKSASSMFSLTHQQSPPSENFAGHASLLEEGLFELNDLLFPDCNMLPWPSDFATDFGIEEFCTGPPTLDREKNQFEYLCNMQPLVNSSTFCIDQGMEEFYDNTGYGDWIPE